jgi:hypothetical protein
MIFVFYNKKKIRDNPREVCVADKTFFKSFINLHAILFLSSSQRIFLKDYESFPLYLSKGETQSQDRATEKHQHETELNMFP